MIYDQPNQYLSPAKTIKALRQECISYLFEDPTNKVLSKSQEEQIALAEYMFEQEQNNRTLFHMTITYKPFADRYYNEKDVNVFFKNFYIKRFLPYLMNTRNYATIAMKRIQPITFSFVDEHEQKPIEIDYFDSNLNNIRAVPVAPLRLHHHAILAVHPATVKRMNSLIGLNTFANSDFSPKIMTSDLKQCEPLRLMYASKLLQTYPEFMSFPDKYSRNRQKYND
jgi:AAA15 family ATPase/GTPase